MAFNFLQSFLSSGHLGVDIGTSSIKAVELGRDGDTMRLKNYALLESYGHGPRVGTAPQTSTMQAIDQDAVELLRLLMSRMKASTRQAVASIPSSAGFMTVVELPQMNSKELVSAIGFQAREHVPLPLEDVLLDWTPIDTISADGVSKQRILLVAIPRELVESYESVFKRAGLTLTSLELDSIALARAAAPSDPTATAIIDIGARVTTISIVRFGLVLMTSSSQTAGNDITQAISRSLRVGTRRAEELKKMRGIKSVSGEEELANLMIPFIDAVIGDARRTMRIYEEQYTMKIERVMLSGGTANLPGLIPYVASLVNLPVVSAFPFTTVQYPASVEPVIRELGPVISVATGLALRGLLPR
jgi:type IV pilus assembly protein PilM